MKWHPFVKFFLLILGLIIVSVLAALLLLPPLYEGKAQAYLKAKITNETGLALSPFQTEISSWKNFPSMTVSLHNIALVDTAHAEPLEVLAARHVEVLLPILQLPYSGIRVSEVYLDGVSFHQRVDSAGNKISLIFRKKNKENADPDELSMRIRKVVIRNSSILSENYFKQSAFSLQLIDSELTAEVKEGLLEIQGKLEGRINHISSKDLHLFRDNEFTADASYTFDLRKKQGTIQESRAMLNGNEVLISGTHQKAASGLGSELDLHFKGTQPFFFLLNQMAEVRSIPLLKQVESDGRVQLHYHIAGRSGPIQRPRNRLHFDLEDGRLHWPTTRFTLSHIQMAGQLDNGPQHTPESSSFTLHRLSASTGKDSLQLSARITNFTKPYIDAQLSGSYTLDSLAEVLPPAYVSLPRGTLAGNVAIKGNLHASKDRRQEQDLKWQGVISLHEVGFQPAKLTVPCTEVNGEARLAGNELRLHQMRGKLGGKPFRVEGSLKDAMNYLLGQHETVSVDGAVMLQQVKTDWIKLKQESRAVAPREAVAAGDTSTTILPAFLRVNVRLVCQQLDLQKTSVENMRARLRSNGRRVTLSNIGLTTQGVAVTGNVSVPNDNRQLYAADLQLSARLDSLDLTSMEQVNSLANATGTKKTAVAKDKGLEYILPLQKAQINLHVSRINLPGAEDLEDLSVQLNKNKGHVMMRDMRFRTTKGGAASAYGGFYLVNSKPVRPYLDVTMQYGFLDLQAFMQNMAALKTLLPPDEPGPSAPPTVDEKEALRKKVYDLGLHVKAQELKYEYLTGTNLVIDAQMNREQAQLEELHLNAFGGTIHSRGVMYLNEPTDTIPVRLKAQVQDIDLEQLFAFAEQMELDVLGSQNIKGTADCYVTVFTKLDQTFTPGFDQTVAYSRATFQDMELIDVKPIQEALGFMRKERTGHLFFEDVDADFVLYKNKFVAPGFSLNNNLSAFDLRGSYTMKGAANLSLDVNVFDILFGNNERRIEKIQEDSLSLNNNQSKQHLLLVREAEKYKVKLSNRKEREDISLVLRNEFLDVLRQYQIDTAFSEIK
ncbi:AsmA-like protein [Pontibacter mucosus]|uniref:AsmA-like protein n=1 Tax=Pontibacter mucosus TaxID=1649266 RepID=A0A2T5YQB7_9BACT|nr:AsmA family protein [Pontibacter mucosus]PTX21509.1 AsmA-like protein [Pontibacter mucosus]